MPWKSPARWWRHEAAACAALLLVALALWSLAYTAPFMLTLAIGGDAALQRRDDDQPFLRGFNASEPASASEYRWWLLPPGYAYRWTTADAAVELPGPGGGRWLISLLAQNGRPDQPAAVVWQAGGAAPLAFDLPPGEARRYSLLADSGPAGDLRLSLQATPYRVPGDPRELGFVLRRLHAVPLGPLTPPPAQLGLLSFSLAVIYGMARWLALGRRGALLGGLACALVTAYCLAYHRLALTSYSLHLALLALSCLLLATAVVVVSRLRLVQRSSAVAPGRHGPVSVLLALILLAFALRLGGMLHPQALFSDARFNANNLLRTGLGEILLSAGLPAETGGGSAPYPPGLYLILLPLQLLFPAAIEGRMLLVQSSVALLDSLVLGLIWLLLRHAGYSPRTALLGAACYLLPPPMLQSFSIGEYANLGGQALAMGFIALLAAAAAQPPAGQARPALFALLCAALTFSLLVHAGVTLSLGAFLAAAWMLCLVGLLLGRANAAARLKGLTIIGLAALALVVLAFYSAPQYSEGLARRVGGEAAQVARGSSPLTILRQTGLSLLGLARPQGRAPLPLLLGPAALLGLIMIGQGIGSRPARGALSLVLAAWWLGMLLGQGLLLFADQGLRWTLFLYPALCLGAGTLLGALTARGRSGRTVAYGLLAAMLVYGLQTWIVQIRDYIHI